MTASCSLAPDNDPPKIATPDYFKEQPPIVGPQLTQGMWKEAEPMDAAARGAWWKIFGDEALNALQQDAKKANPSLTAAAARVERARETVRASASTILPTVDIGGNAVRAQPGSAGVAAFGGNPNAQLNPYTLYAAGASASYEVDLFGRVRDNEKALSFEADTEEALYQNVLLALSADVAQHYFSIRALDAERALLKETIAVRREAQRIMQKRFDLGEAGDQDLSRTKSDLASAEAELAALDRQRAMFEHALAVLLGKLPSQFMFAEAPLDGLPPEIPAGLPSSLLERRPDVAAAEAQMAAANARIGVARTALFPRLILAASGGYESTTLSDVFNWSNRTWALGQLAGNALSMTVFDNGRNLARIHAADAAYNETVANYRVRVLAAFRDVEDNLSGQRLLAMQSLKSEEAAASAQRTLALVRRRYDEGDVNYFEVTDADRGALAASRAAVQARGQRFLTTVSLIRALGGGWEIEADAPAESPASDEDES